MNKDVRNINFKLERSNPFHRSVMEFFDTLPKTPSGRVKKMNMYILKALELLAAQKAEDLELVQNEGQRYKLSDLKAQLDDFCQIETRVKDE